MHKNYPYLQDSFIYNTNIETQKRSLLKKIEQQITQRQYVKITLLDWNENPIKSLEGEITSGSISKVVNSPVRRTANLSCSVNAGSYSVEDAKMDFAINKKIFIEIGIKNETDVYPDYPIFWFPEGVFFIGSFSINASAAGSVNISLTLKDKMAMLNGDVGGKIPITTIFDSMDTQLPNGEYIEQKVLIYNIIKELVNHFGGESLDKIVIEGVPLRIRRIMRWTGDNPLYAYSNQENMGTADMDYVYTLEKPSDDIAYTTYNKGDDAGYIMDDFVISNELTAAPGESVTSVLDKIKNILGNYEYFYDVFGVFHFREIKNYYVTTQARTLLDEMNKNQYLLGTNLTEKDYLVETNNSRSVFTFDSINLLTSINVTPQYENIKNDYIVEGKTQSESGVTFNVRYHLAIDSKPLILGVDSRNSIYQWDELNKTFINVAPNPSLNKSYYGIYPTNADRFGDDPDANSTLIFYLHPRGNYPTAAYVANVLELPEVGNFNLIYHEKDSEIYKYWDGQQYLDIEPAAIYTTDLGYEYYATDWRTKLYLDGLRGVINGTDKGYYYEELAAFWPMVYDLKNQCFYGEQDSNSIRYKTLTVGTYYLDFLDSLSASFGEWNINNIGRRTNITVNDEINCIFQPEIPNVVLLPTTIESVTIDGWNALEEGRTIEELIEECQQNYYPWTQIDDEIYNQLLTGGYKNAAFDQIKYELYLHTRYQKSISMNSIPVFYLEPNSRITINDSITNTYGDFIVQSINITLGPGANMSITCNEAAERF